MQFCVQVSSLKRILESVSYQKIAAMQNNILKVSMIRIGINVVVMIVA